MASILWAVYLVVAVTVDCRYFHGHHSQNTSIELEEPTEVFDIEAADGVHLVDDMILNEEQWAALRERKAIRDITKRWSEGPVSMDGSGNNYPEVPYIFMNNAVGVNITAIKDGIAHWEKHTCIMFKENPKLPINKAHLQFHKALDDKGNPVCQSYVGMRNSQKGQKISIPNTSHCSKLGTVVHEIGHALGFFHEHNRSDRKQYIELIDNNIPKDKNGDFKNYKLETQTDDYTTKYDYSSVMHYGANQGSIDYKVTMVTKPDPMDLELLGNREGLSFRDIRLANKMYGCEEKWAKACGKAKEECGEGYYGRVNKVCECVCPPDKMGSQCKKVNPVSNGDYYYEKRNKVLNEIIVSPKPLTVIAPSTKEAKFVKSVIPPACKMAIVAFTSSNLFSSPILCSCQFLHAVIDENDLEGETLCDADLRNGAILKSEEKITITTIIKEHCYLDFLKGKTLWEAEVTFVDTECPTNPTGHDWCSSIFQFDGKWTETWTKKHWVEGKLKITFPKTVSSWNLELTFNQDINDLIIWDMKKVITSERIVTLTPKTYNTEQVAGNILNPAFQFNYFGSETPKLISVTLNGDELC